MEIFETVAEMGHERVLLCSNPEVGLRALIAVHSTVLGPGLGGLRMWPFKSDGEALTDVLRLSRGMTYKAAAAGLNLGGGKAVILGDPKVDKSEALFRAFGRYVESLNGLYITAEDVGTDMEDMELILTETRWVTGVSPAHGGGGDPSPVTAYGCLQGIKAALRERYEEPDLAGRSVAIQGLGSVGYHLAKYLKEEGAKVFGSDIDIERRTWESSSFLWKRFSRWSATFSRHALWVRSSTRRQSRNSVVASSPEPPITSWPTRNVTARSFMNEGFCMLLIS
jgi:leucine dehydrogenase